ncbi:hypothetical protein GCM10009430_12820 [Aquimarina litoralis]|uniref:TonB-dependent receptor plug domain-containing protein n=1 Tax=Aquimarina litoralis TaxID=584605 RepID=A0ABN1ILH6_9FLAO
MKKILLALLIFYSGNLFSQAMIQIRSVVADRNSRQPLKYVNVGFVDRGLGTVTDKEGYFELSFLEKRITNNDTLQITSQNYYPLRIAFSDLKSIMDKTKVFYLSKIPIDLEITKKEAIEVTVKGQVGSTDISEDKIGWSEESMKGSEFASLIDLPSNKDTQLLNLKFNVANHKADSSKVRINFYSVVSGIPGAKITKSCLYSIKDKSGEQVIDLRNQEIIVNSRFIVGIELLDSYGDYANQLQLNMSRNLGISYLKSSSQDTWQNVPYKMLDFSFDVLRSQDVLVKEDVGEQSINGVVKVGKKPLQGCEVMVKGQLYYTYTKSDGTFSIKAKKGDVLEFRSLVTKPKDVTVQEPQNMKVALRSKYDSLSEVILNSESEENKELVIGLGIGPVKKRSLGYGVYSLDNKDFNKFAINVPDLIRGRFPGLFNGFGRGSSSFILSNRRAVVVDGAVFIGDINTIDPNIVASISWVPGLAGNTIYGTNARNGVLYITTKAAMRNLESVKRKEKRNSLLVKGNYYKNSAREYQETFKFETSAVNLLTAASFETAKSIYLEELPKNKSNISFYKEAFTYFLQWEEKYAYEILGIGIEITYNNPKALRALAFLYEEKERFHVSHRIYKRIGELEPQRAQSYMDLAQSYVSIGDYKKAFSLYKLILDNKIPGVVFGDSVLQIAVTEIKYLVTKHKIDVDYRDLHPSFYSKAQDLDGRIVFEWNDPQSEFDIQFVNPNGKYFTWQHSVSASPKELNKERLEGYNTKEFILEESDPGIWLVNLKGHTRNDEYHNVPRFVKCTLYKSYGMPDQSKTIKIIELHKIVDDNFSIASLQLD